MSNRIFCVMLASVLMLMGALTALIIKAPDADLTNMGEVMQAYLPSGQEQKEELLLPKASEVIEAYGASYSEEYGQWSLCEQMSLETERGSMVHAPLSGIVEKIEGIETASGLSGAGSRITIQCSDISICIYPVYTVRVFEGSRVTQESFIGSMGDVLMVYAEKNGVPVDPMTISGE